MIYSNDGDKITYRPYIDGLRGLAVLAVVFYHAKFFSFSGGFVGVDIFFVISGFLITSIILRDLKVGDFSIIKFWERRIRRIIPVLFVVIMSSIIAAYFLILYPKDYFDFGSSVVAQSVFSSNILFMSTDNYFDQLSKSSPLLHTWSLSVEEQFYIVFPFIVLFCVSLVRRFNIVKNLGSRKTLLVITVILSVVSMFASIWFVNFIPGSIFKSTTYASVGFYSLLTRAWEIGVGILLALCLIKVRSIKLAEILSILGITAIAVSFFMFNDHVAFPGIAALLPVLGVAAIIIANENHITKIGKLLSNKSLVWVGLISYSLYLWHWPLLVFAKFTSISLSKILIIGLISVAIILSWLTYKFIETPFRKKLIFKKISHIYIFGFLCLLSLAFLGFLIKRSSVVISDRIPIQAKSILLASDEIIPWGGNCFRLPDEELNNIPICRIGSDKPDPEKQFVLWGDSHAEALAPMFDKLGKEYFAQGVVFSNGSCIPVRNVHQIPPTEGCDNKNKEALAYIKEKNIKHIILVARWSYYITGGPNNIQVALITDSDIPSSTHAESQVVFERNFIPMILEWSNEGREIYVMKQVPEQSFNSRDAFYKAIYDGKEVNFQGVLTKTHEDQQKLVNSVMDSISKRKGIHILDPASIFCKKRSFCSLEIGGRLIYRDEDHMSTTGAMSLKPLFVSIFK